MVNHSGGGLSRRHLLASGAALAGASMLPQVSARAQPRARWRRYNVASPEGQAMMVHYANGIRAMLKLPPSHPCNWYRAGFTHFLDCPHGNWWLLPWHRGFTGWIEQMVRKYSGFDGFAFPYWDWTANPQIPAIMMDKSKDNVLNPNADAFIGKSDNFQRAFKDAINDAGYWKKGSAQLEQLKLRGYPDSGVMWDQILKPPTGPAFFEQPNTRNPNPNLDCVTGPAVSGPTLKRALAPQDFMTFGSPSAAQHSIHAGSGVLEGFPHNKVHNNTGGIIYSVVDGVCDTKNPYLGQGFMQWNLSPVDPLFFLHHSNLDRLWDAWTRTRGENRFQLLPPAGPPYYYYEHWSAEPFLFFYGPDGQPVTKNKAGDYQTIPDYFAYDYQPGTGDPGVPLRAALAARPRPPVRRFASEIARALNDPALLAAPPILAIRATPAFLQATRAAGVQAVFAKVTVTLPPHGRGQAFRVLVHTGKPAQSVEAGTISLFGHHGAHSGQGTGTFVIPLDDALAELRRRGVLKANALLYFRVEAPPNAGHHGARLLSVPPQRDLPVDNVVIEAH